MTWGILVEIKMAIERLRITGYKGTDSNLLVDCGDGFSLAEQDLCFL